MTTPKGHVIRGTGHMFTYRSAQGEPIAAYILTYGQTALRYHFTSKQWIPIDRDHVPHELSKKWPRPNVTPK